MQSSPKGATASKISQFDNFKSYNREGSEISVSREGFWLLFVEVPIFHHSANKRTL